MLDNFRYFIGGTEHMVSVASDGPPTYGEDVVLSNMSDPTNGFSWFNDGFAEIEFLSSAEHRALVSDITETIKQLSNTNLQCLSEYDSLITQEQHLNVVRQTRDLFDSDLRFSTNFFIERLSECLGTKLTDVNEQATNKERMHVIVRINRPQSNDFNPAHKDIYEPFDHFAQTPPFINFWIPIFGVSKNSSLPIVPSSHMINEEFILRHKAGTIVNGNQYRVSCIKSWNESTQLVRTSVKDGQCLTFSPNLIHGMAINNGELTRVALEFRLYNFN